MSAVNAFTRDATTGSRSLHWVLKIGNLKKSLDFLQNVIGLRVLRHEEFGSGCEATCNGPYGGAWSKTMVGFGDEKYNFVLELTYNYGIDSYKFGNDLQYIALHHPSALARAKAFGYPIENEDTIVGPDNYKFKILSPIRGIAEQFVCVALRSSKLSQSLSYWSGILGLGQFPVPEGLKSKYPSALVGFGNDQTKLHFIEIQDKQPIDHALSSGRIAFGCKKVPPIYELIQTTGDKVATPPLTLPTPGKADVVVTILIDRDGYEICFVEDEAFYDLATPLFDIVDFDERSKRGGDGVPLPTAVKIEHNSQLVTAIESEEDAEKAITVPGDKLVVMDFYADWCHNCKRIYPFIESLAKQFGPEKVTIYSVNVDEAQEVGDMYGVTTLPRLLFFKNGAIVGDYLGSNEKEIQDNAAATVLHCTDLVL